MVHLVLVHTNGSEWRSIRTPVYRSTPSIGYSEYSGTPVLSTLTPYAAILGVEYTRSTEYLFRYGVLGVLRTPYM
jgi:hypothetical protein